MSDRPDRLFYIKELYRRLREVGLSSNKMWVLREERRGNLKFQRDPSNRRRLIEREINEVITAFSPGGRGHWSWDGSIEKDKDAQAKGK